MVSLAGIDEPMPKGHQQPGRMHQEQEKDKYRTRSLKITRTMLQEMGYTEGCEGCRYAQTGMEENRSHSEKCRKRIEEQLRKTEDGMRKLKEQESRRKAAEERKESDRAAVSGCTKGNEEKQGRHWHDDRSHG